MCLAALLCEQFCRCRMDQVPGGGYSLIWLYRYVRPQRYGFSAVLVINRVSNLADSGHK